jgi:lipoprotein signal peptidase
MKNIRYVLTVLGLIGIDQWSKWFVPFRGIQPVSYNQGISFGWFDGLPREATMVLIVLITMLLVFLLRRALRDAWEAYPYLVILFGAGGTSNLLDRLLFGGVRDWLLIPYTGVYNNLADWYIFVAIVGLLLVELRDSTRSRAL